MKARAARVLVAKVEEDLVGEELMGALAVGGAMEVLEVAPAAVVAVAVDLVGTFEASHHAGKQGCDPT